MQMDLNSMPSFQLHLFDTSCLLLLTTQLLLLTVQFARRILHIGMRRGTNHPWDFMYFASGISVCLVDFHSDLEPKLLSLLMLTSAASDEDGLWVLKKSFGSQAQTS